MYISTGHRIFKEAYREVVLLDCKNPLNIFLLLIILMKKRKCASYYCSEAYVKHMRRTVLSGHLRATSALCFDETFQGN